MGQAEEQYLRPAKKEVSNRNLNRKINSKVGNLKGNRAGLKNSSKRTLGDARNKSRQNTNRLTKSHLRAGGVGKNVNVGMSSEKLREALKRAKRMNDKSAAIVYKNELDKRNKGLQKELRRKRLMS